MKTRRILGVAFVAVTMTQGCSSIPAGATCETDDDCVGDLTCIDGICILEDGGGGSGGGGGGAGGAGGGGGGSGGTGGGGGAMTGQPLSEPFAFNPANLGTPVTHHVEPGITGSYLSVEGSLEIVVARGTVSSAMEVTLARVSAAAPIGSIGDVYQVDSGGVSFSKPVHVRFAATVPGSVLASHTRPVQFDTGATSYRVLDGWTYLAATGQWTGDITSDGVYGVANGDEVLLSDDSPSGGYARGVEYLALRRPAEAAAAFDAALANDASNREAHMGAALSKLVIVPESTVADDLLLRCDQSLIDLQTFLGSSGLLAFDERTRLGSSTLTAQRGLSVANLSPMAFEPNAIRALRRDDTNLNIEVQVTDSINATSGGLFRLHLRFYSGPNWPDWPAWVDGVTYDLAALPFNPGYVAYLINDDAFGYRGDIRPVSGTIQVTDAGTNADVGERLAITLSDVTFERLGTTPIAGCDMQCCTDECGGLDCSDSCCTDYCPNYPAVEVYVLNGEIVDALHETHVLQTSALPFGSLEYIAGPPARSVGIQALESCGTGLNADLALDTYQDLRATLEPVRAHLQAIVASSPNTFSFEVPIGMVGNTLPVRLGAVEVYALLALFAAADTAEDIAVQYRFFDGNLESMIVTDAISSDLDVGQMGTQLNSDFIRANTPPEFIPGVRDGIVDAIAKLTSALQATPPAEAAFHPQNGPSKASADELVDFGDLVLASEAGPEPLLGTPEYSVYLGHALDTPLTRDLVLFETGLTEMFEVFVWDALELREPARREMLASILSSPPTPSPPVFCQDSGECPPAQECNQWGDDGTPGVCYSNRSVSCLTGSDCCGGGGGAGGGAGGTGGSGGAGCDPYCDHQHCGLREPMPVAETLMQDLFEPTVPTFITPAAWESVCETWGYVSNNATGEP